MTRRPVVALGAAVAAATVVAAGCTSASFSIGGQSPESAATDLIEGELADLIGLGELSADCADVDDAQIGTEFACSATTADGRVVEFVTVIDREDHIDVTTTNVIRGDVIPDVEAAAIDLINANQGTSLTRQALDCPEDSIVWTPATELACVLTDGDGTVFDAVITFPDVESGDFSIDWTPRP